MAAAATTNSDANTNFFIRPSDIRDRLCGDVFFESGQTKALSLMIYDNLSPAGNITPDVANERGIVIQSKLGPH
jgi:hypothetical protein